MIPDPETGQKLAKNIIGFTGRLSLKSSVFKLRWHGEFALEEIDQQLTPSVRNARYIYMRFTDEEGMPSLN